DLATITYNDKLKVFSIDDVNTTEIDDAFSVAQLDNGTYQIGVHIAAPALDSSTEEVVSDNISTVYYPGHKLPMLPESIIDQFSLV
ncbi:RNB domain-containing ribonuclease, partial [Rhizobium phaseoli]|uniref:RNB domain-containing ribonuclease n=1 Tax=Rhizobium phaseoli TaxID=396 RepID=UPI0014368F19